MSTAGPVRPIQALRQRRESQRPSQLRSSTRNAQGEAEEAVTADKIVEKPFVINEQYILKKFKGSPPSLIVHLHQHHFRFEQQDGNFPYNSPMRPLIQHIRDGTIPHFMLEEMLRAGVQFYEGCLIVQLVDHRTTDAKAQAGAVNSVAKEGKTAQFSIHNWNEYLTPSPYVPYPSPPKSSSGDSPPPKSEQTNRPTSSAGEIKAKAESAATEEAKIANKTPRVTTKVLFPTQLSQQTELELLANTPMPDPSASRRQQSRAAATPMSAHPPTPLTSMPPTPSTSRAPASKRQKMILDETNVHHFEADVIHASAPALFLEPVHSLLESQDIIEATTHPMHKNAPPLPKSRKRTTAELAADEAQFAADQNFMLFGDSAAPAAGAGQISGEGEGIRSGAAAFEPRFSRFKTLENIKIAHEENERIKKEEEVRQAQLKREQQANADAIRRREAEASAQQAEQNRLMAQRQQQQQQAMQAEQMRRHAQAQAQAAGSAMGTPLHTQFSQPQQQNSPMVRQQTPMQASPVMNANAVATHAMGGVPMAPTTSSQAGSPPRPPSAVPHSAGPQGMARQMSRQHSSQHPGSTHGTPQMHMNTPQMNQAVPVTRHMTPQPGRVNQHGSPVGGMQGTQMMPGGGQMPQNLTQEQMMRIQQMRRNQMLQQQQQNMAMAGSPQHMTPEHMQVLRQQQVAQAQAQAQLAQQNQGSNNGTPTPYNAQLAQQMRQQMAQSASPNPGQQAQQRPGGNPGQQGMMAANMMGGMNMANLTPEQQQVMMQRQRTNMMAKRIMAHFNGSVPAQIQNMIRQGQIGQAWQIVQQQAAQQQQHQQQQGGQGGGQNNMGGGQGGQGGGMGQMNMGGMGGMGSMAGQMSMGAGVAGVPAGMPGGGNMAGMTMQQMQQMQMRLQQQHQQAAAAAAQQQQQGEGAQNQQAYMARLMRQQQLLAQRQQQQQQQQQGMMGGSMGMGGNMGMGMGWNQGMGRGQGGMG